MCIRDRSITDRISVRIIQASQALKTRFSQDEEQGSTTVEYAIGAVATAGFAGLLVAVLKSGSIKGLLQGIIESALSL